MALLLHCTRREGCTICVDLDMVVFVQACLLVQSYACNLLNVSEGESVVKRKFSVVSVCFHQKVDVVP